MVNNSRPPGNRPWLYVSRAEQQYDDYLRQYEDVVGRKPSQEDEALYRKTYKECMDFAAKTYPPKQTHLRQWFTELTMHQKIGKSPWSSMTRQS